MTIASKYRRNPGFTIIETLMAVVVIAVGFGAVAMTAIRTLDVVDETRLRFLALSCAKNKLVSMQVMDVWPDSGLSSDEEEQGGAKFHVETLSSQTPHQGYVKVEISVALKNGDGRKLATLAGFLRKERNNETSGA